MSHKVELQFSSKKVLNQSYEDLRCWGAIRSCSELRRGMEGEIGGMEGQLNLYIAALTSPEMWTAQKTCDLGPGRSLQTLS